jgi:hypothetical protein
MYIWQLCAYEERAEKQLIVNGEQSFVIENQGSCSKNDC